MLSRRNIRIKVLQHLYAFQQQDANSVPVFHKQLDKHFSEYYKFYYFSLRFLIDFDTFLESERDIEKEKYFPNKNHIRNTEVLHRLYFFKSLEASEDFVATCGKLPYDWKKHGDLFDRIFVDLVQMEFFTDFSVFDQPSPEVQKDFLINLFEFLFNEFELFDSAMEDEYIHWEDDSADILKAIIHTIESFYEKNRLKIERMGEKQIEDIQFGAKLFEKCIVNREQLDEVILSNTANWDSERLTINDMIMLRMALAEFLYFETIPPKVTINEYLDIAKSYSTPKSHLFLNGVLDKIRIVLNEKGQINKIGRGLKNE
ncbi:MAG: transcription antitermination factor NusB [Bacteroidetes bacterium]|nr:transcription antitermination factor NusB [Bacteroidota bacterium]